MALSPMMQEYVNTKKEYSDCILLYRLGDFYEMFFEDAIEVANVLNLTLTSKACGLEEKAPMCGIPQQALDTYISKLIKLGYKVAICEQLEDPRFAKGIVKRGVVKIVTPGMVLQEELLDSSKNNYILSIYFMGYSYSIAALDISTGELKYTYGKLNSILDYSKIVDIISSIDPKEIIANREIPKEFLDQIQNQFKIYITLKDEEYFKENLNKLKEELKEKYSIDSKEMDYTSLLALDRYVKDTQKVEKLEHIRNAQFINDKKYMVLNAITRKNLELNQRIRDMQKKNSLLYILDNTKSAMGARMLYNFLNCPLKDKDLINLRLDSVEEFYKDIVLCGKLRDRIKQINDITRIISKASYSNFNARDLLSIKNSIKNLPQIKEEMKLVKASLNKRLYDELDCLEDIYKIIDDTVVEEPPTTINDGGMIKENYSKELYEIINISDIAREKIAKIEYEQKEKLDIKNLKIGYNRIFGYFIEITKSNISKVPDSYIRKQTLVNCERFTTSELLELEEEISKAHEKRIEMELEIFNKLRNVIILNTKRIQKTCDIIATIDIFTNFAYIARNNNYVRPNINDDGIINLKGSRHPVIEKMLPNGEFVDNFVYLNNKDSFIVLTGPNMGGKSTYMRQIALIQIMMQIGSFVPANYANMCIIDQIFTRIGASDDISRGQSTFMVEMQELAYILKNATKDSLIILDEVGRGTSTYDGMSIAAASIEYLAKLKAKTLFATHYNELVDFSSKIEGVKNYHVGAIEKDSTIIFSRKIEDGGSSKSYGINVATLANLDPKVVARAKQILANIEKRDEVQINTLENYLEEENVEYESIKYKEISEFLKKIDVDKLSPFDAYKLLYELKGKIEKGEN